MTADFRAGEHGTGITFLVEVTTVGLHMIRLVQ